MASPLYGSEVLFIWNIISTLYLEDDLLYDSILHASLRVIKSSQGGCLSDRMNGLAFKPLQLGGHVGSSGGIGTHLIGFILLCIKLQNSNIQLLI